MARTKQEKANIPNLQKLLRKSNHVLDSRPIIAVTMRECGCTFDEIGEVMGFTRQMAETMVKNAQAKL